jgi:LPLT family lysophospholipid transporter-like MFS transporter
MNRGFYTIMAAQFFSSLADNALMICSDRSADGDESPGLADAAAEAVVRAVLRLLAAFVGAFADSMPKGRVMFIANLIKVVGCALIFFTSIRCSPMPWSASAPPCIRPPSTAS